MRCLSSGLPIITNTRPPLIEIEKASAVSVFKSNKAAPIRWALADNKLGLRCCNDRSHSRYPFYRRMRAVHFGFGAAIRREKLLRDAFALSVAVGGLPSDLECDAASSA